MSWNTIFSSIDTPWRSHAPRERVSWNGNCLDIFWTTWLVTLHVSVWVEIWNWDINQKNWKSHAPRERVSWNTIHSTNKPLPTSHAPRERVSWNILDYKAVNTLNSHAPRERVSWNLCTQHSRLVDSVTLHVSVWVEINLKWAFALTLFVTLHVSVWVEMGIGTYAAKSAIGHAPRERVSWNIDDGLDDEEA